LVARWISEFVTFRNSFEPMMVALYVHAMNDIVRLELETSVVDRNEARKIEVNFNHSFHVGSYQRPLEKNEVMYVIRKLFHDMVLHEVDESLLFDGVRVFDPHKGETL
jgi:hypothetical protein